jgi:hypothetical protein
MVHMIGLYHVYTKYKTTTFVHVMSGLYVTATFIPNQKI